MLYDSKATQPRLDVLTHSSVPLAERNGYLQITPREGLASMRPQGVGPSGGIPAGQGTGSPPQAGMNPQGRNIGIYKESRRGVGIVVSKFTPSTIPARMAAGGRPVTGHFPAGGLFGLAGLAGPLGLGREVEMAPAARELPILNRGGEPFPAGGLYGLGDLGLSLKPPKFIRKAIRYTGAVVATPFMSAPAARKVFGLSPKESSQFETYAKVARGVTIAAGAAATGYLVASKVAASKAPAASAAKIASMGKGAALSKTSLALPTSVPGLLPPSSQGLIATSGTPIAGPGLFTTQAVGAGTKNLLSTASIEGIKTQAIPAAPIAAGANVAAGGGPSLLTQIGTGTLKAATAVGKTGLKVIEAAVPSIAAKVLVGAGPTPGMTPAGMPIQEGGSTTIVTGEGAGGQPVVVTGGGGGGEQAQYETPGLIPGVPNWVLIAGIGIPVAYLMLRSPRREYAL